MSELGSLPTVILYLLLSYYFLLFHVCLWLSQCFMVRWVWADALGSLFFSCYSLLFLILGIVYLHVMLRWFLCRFYHPFCCLYYSGGRFRRKSLSTTRPLANLGDFLQNLFEKTKCLSFMLWIACYREYQGKSAYKVYSNSEYIIWILCRNFYVYQNQTLKSEKNTQTHTETC